MFKKGFVSLPSLFVVVPVFTMIVGINAATAKPKTLKTTSSSQTLAYNHKWKKTPFGAFVSPIKGDRTKGKHVTLVRFPAGHKTPVHTHSQAVTGIVITGVSAHYEPDNKSTMVKLTAGGHWTIPANTPHVDQCYEGNGECLMVLMQDDKFDFIRKK